MTPTKEIIVLLSILCVAAGAIVAAIARFLITHFSSELSHHHAFPSGTLCVTVLRCLVVGYVLTGAWFLERQWQLLVHSPRQPLRFSGTAMADGIQNQFDPCRNT